MADASTKEKQDIWGIIILVVPFFLVREIGSLFLDSSDNTIIYSALFGGIGALIGFLLQKLVSGKNQAIKIITLAIVVILGFGAMFLLKPDKQSDETLSDIEWKTQTIGKIEFDTPRILTSISGSILEEAKPLYNKLNIYTDEEDNGRVTIFNESELKEDTLGLLPHDSWCYYHRIICYVYYGSWYS